nr:hypothetical protein [uncultured Methanobrevibacter sp.]
MKGQKSLKPTLVLNKKSTEEFLDFNSSKDLAEVKKVLKKLMKE